MACESFNALPESLERIKTDIAKLEQGLQQGTVQVVIGTSGGITFKGWVTISGLMDGCVYRRLLSAGSPGLRLAIAKAEAMSGRKLNPRAIASGVHSHDGGSTWSKH